jgi:hypothetical protein
VGRFVGKRFHVAYQAHLSAIHHSKETKTRLSHQTQISGRPESTEETTRQREKNSRRMLNSRGDIIYKERKEDTRLYICGTDCWLAQVLFIVTASSDLVTDFHLQKLTRSTISAILAI